MFRNSVAIDYRETGVDTVLRGGKGFEVVRAETEAEALQRRLAAERAVDSVLADSFPASDPPSWTLGITRPQPERQATNDETVARDNSRAVAVPEHVIDVSRATERTFWNGLVSVAGAAGIVLVVPFVVLLIGMPIALALRGVVEAAHRLLLLILR